MNVWVFNHYAESPDGAATRTFDLGRALVGKGHRVTIFACSFSHYRLREEHFTKRLRFVKVEEREGVRFIWLRGLRYGTNDWRRIANFVGYAVSSFLCGLAKLPRPHVVIGSSVHPLGGLAALAVSRLIRRPFFLEVPDLWPQVLIDFGRIGPEGRRARVLRRIERILLHGAERIIMLWRDTDEYVHRLGIAADKQVWIPHVVDPRLYDGLPDYADHEPPFTVMYLGSLVESMALDVVLDAASILLAAGRNDIRIVLIGGGSERSRLVSRAQQLRLSNVEIREPVPKAEVPKVLASADCFLCCTKRLPVYRYGMSMSKTCEYLMAGRPVVFAGESTYNPVAEAQAGITVKAEDPEALAAAIQEVIDLPFDTRRDMGQRGRAWVARRHDVRILADRLEQVLLSGMPAEATRA